MFFGLALIIVGVIFLLEKMGIVTGAVWGYVWPCLLIALGLAIVLGRRCCGMKWHSRMWHKSDDEVKK